MSNYPKITVIPLNCGRLSMERRYFNGKPNDRCVLELPVFCFLIIHPQGCILFDTGLPQELWSGLSKMELLTGLTATAGNSVGLVREIENRGYLLKDISIIVNSHSHLDHVGGNSLIPGAQFFVQDGEKINYGTDLFADGTIYLLPTPGHSKDHQSMLVRGKNRQVLLTGDACFRPANLIELWLPLILEEHEKALCSLKKLKDISNEFGTVVLTSHDPSATGETIIL